MVTIHPSNRLAAIAVLALLLVGQGIAHAQQQPWTTVGSAGTVDEQDLSLVNLVNGEAQMLAAAAAPATLNIRYNIVALDDIVGLGQYAFNSRFRDNGNGAQVRLRLNSYSLGSGITSTVATFDSNSFPSAVGYQTRGFCIFPDFNFADHAYFIDAELIKTGASGTPALGIVQIETANCIP